MKTAIAIIALATIANAAPMLSPDGGWHDQAPSRYEGGGIVAAPVNAEWLIANAGWRYATQAEIDAKQAEAEAAAIAAEAARIAGKPDNLKKAENRFLAAMASWNADHPQQAITTEDGFLEIEAKIEASDLPEAKQLKASAKLRNYWDLVEFHGGRFGDIQWHPEAVGEE